MLNKIKENETLLEKINGKILAGDKKYYPFLASISSLENNNELQKEIIGSLETEGSNGKNLIKLYSLLQGMFVSIDSLYALSYILTDSKNYININQNKQLRELKYIRNDVIGHPVKRIYEDSKIGYCILKKDLVVKDSFKYYIYFNNEIKSREVKMADLITSYYEEANKLLYRLSNVKTDANEANEILQMVKKIYKKFNSDDDVSDDLLELRNLFLSLNKELTKKDNRFLWRIELLIKLNNTYADEKEYFEILEYCSGYQLSKLYEIATGEDNEIANTKKVPKSLVSFFKMLSKNDSITDTVKYLFDMTHPLFLSSYERCVDFAVRNDYQQAVKYLELIKKAYDKNDSDMVYCYGVVLKNYRKVK